MLTITRANATAPTEKPAGRAAMPLVTAFIDDLRGAFGREVIDGLIRKATVEGLPTFYASEGGRRVGRPLPALGSVVVSAVDMVILEPEKDAHADRNRRR